MNNLYAKFIYHEYDICLDSRNHSFCVVRLCCTCFISIHCGDVIVLGIIEFIMWLQSYLLHNLRCLAVVKLPFFCKSIVCEWMNVFRVCCKAVILNIHSCQLITSLILSVHEGLCLCVCITVIFPCLSSMQFSWPIVKTFEFKQF